MDLLASESSEDEKVDFKINENYAKHYDTWRKKEERQKLLDRYGDVDSSDSSSEEAEIRSTPQMDKDWLRAYAVVRFQQPRLYKKGEKFFHDEAQPVVIHKEKATTLKDHERKFILEKGGIESDEETKTQVPKGKSYIEEQEEIKKSFKDALQGLSDEDDVEEGSGLLMKKQKTTEEQKKEENEYLEWIKGERAELEDKEAAAELAPLKEYWGNPNLSEKEKVLRDYILNNGYMDQEDSDEEPEKDDTIAPNFDAEEEFLEKAEEYEHKYNFRHEEPGGDEIKSYPRFIDTVRTKDSRRADGRKRKLEKKRARNDEIKLLQQLQREAKQEKLEALRKIANNPKLEYDLEADFDPDEHNKIMQKFFSEDYYGDAKGADEKPTFEYDAAIDDEPDDWWQDRLNEEDKDADDTALETSHMDQEENSVATDLEKGDLDDEPYADDPNFVMDADYDPNKDYKAEKRKNKKSKKKETQKLPLFDPTTKTFDEYIDEYLKDKIDKLPFTYREVVPNDFGLSTNEILKANEKELNSWVSVKKMSAYRSKQDELADKRKFVHRSTDIDKKRKILPSLFAKPGESSTGESKKKKKRKRKATDSEETLPSTSQTMAEDEASGDETVAAPEQRLTTSGQNSEQSAVKAKKRKLAGGTATDLDRLNSAVVKDKSDGIDVQSPHKKKKNKNLGINTKGGASHEEMKTPVQESGVNEGHPRQPQADSDPTILNSPSVKEKKTNKVKKQKKDAQKSQVTKPSSDVQKLKKKHKKKKPSISNFDSKINLESSEQQGEKLNKKHRKKKMSISNFGSKSGQETGVQQVDKRQLARQLEKVMLASRFSRYHMGPNAMKMSSKKRKKKKKKTTKQVEES